MHRTIVRCTCIGPRQLTALPPRTMKPKAQGAIHPPFPPDHLEYTRPRASSSMDRNILFDREPFAQLWRSTPIRRDDLSIRSLQASWHAPAQRSLPTPSLEGVPATVAPFPSLVLLRACLDAREPRRLRFGWCRRSQQLRQFSCNILWPWLGRPPFRLISPHPHTRRAGSAPS
jgi:hypothetical protein